jgi:hypothetical protein
MGSNRLSQSAAATSWWDGGNVHIRVYTLSADGKVHESCWDKDSWYSGALSGKFAAISAPGPTSWYVGGQIHIRATALSAEKKTQEVCWDGGGQGWYLGALTNQFSGVYAATSTSWWDGSKIHIRVYALSSNGVIQEFCWDGDGWYSGALTNSKFPALSTPAATSWLDSGGQVHIRVYAQSADNKIQEFCWDKDSWYVGALNGKYTAQSAPGVASWYAGGQIHIRVYVLGDDKKVQEYCWDKDSWYSGALSNQHQANCSPGATSWLDSAGQIHIRVYSTTLGDDYQEFCWDRDHWYVGAFRGT